jgi:hypothetical protein
MTSVNGGALAQAETDRPVPDRGMLSLPDSGLLGTDLANAVIAHVTSRLPTVIDEVEGWLRLQSNGPVSYWFWSVPVLSRVAMHPELEGVTVASAMAGRGRNVAIAHIGMHRDGSLYWRQSRQRTLPKVRM